MSKIDAQREIARVTSWVALKPSRAEQIETLDSLIRHLLKLRRRVSGGSPSAPANHERISAYVSAPAWPWLACGVVAGALIVLLAASARDGALINASAVPVPGAVQAFR